MEWDKDLNELDQQEQVVPQGKGHDVPVLGAGFSEEFVEALTSKAHKQTPGQLPRKLTKELARELTKDWTGTRELTSELTQELARGLTKE